MYSLNSDLPKQVRDSLPIPAQDIYRESFNNSMKEYKKPSKRRDPKENAEEVSHRVAWSAVKNKYSKNNKTGKWKKES
jgi:cation transport regulator